MCNNSEAAVLFVGERYLDLAESHPPRHQDRPARRRASTPRPTGSSTTKSSSRSTSRRRSSPTIDDADPTIVIYTSGTTALPKGVVLTHLGMSVYVTNTVEPADPCRGEPGRAAGLRAVLPRRRRHHDALLRLGRSQDGDPAAVRPGSLARGRAGRTESPTASSYRRCSSASWSTTTSTSTTSAP